MYIKYGNFPFNPGEATFASTTMRTNRTVRGFDLTQSVDFKIVGEVCNTDAAAITSRLNQIQVAFSQAGGDIGLYQDDGTPTTHFLQSAHPNNLTGNQIDYIHFPEITGGEYVDGRKFSIGVSAEVLRSERTLVDYSDAITQRGTGQPDARWRLIPNWGWVSELVSLGSPVRYIHQGYAETLDTWLQPIPPYFTAPPFLDPRATRVTRYHPVKRPQGFLQYRIEWHYEYYLLLPLVGLPTIR